MKIEKVGMYSIDEIYETLTENVEGSFLNRSMVDAMLFKIANLQNRIDKAIEYIKHYETIRGYYEYVENGYDEYNYEEDLKEELLDILKESGE